MRYLNIIILGLCFLILGSVGWSQVAQAQMLPRSTIRLPEGHIIERVEALHDGSGWWLITKSREVGCTFLIIIGTDGTEKSSIKVMAGDGEGR